VLPDPDQLVRAVLADIVEGADDAIAAANAEQALAGDLEGEVVAGFSTWLAWPANCQVRASSPAFSILEDGGSV
jgi:hypothetical protein